MTIETLRLVRYGVFALIAVLGLFWAGVGSGLIDLGSEAPTAGTFGLGNPAVGSFKLTDQEGRAVSDSDLRGRPVVMFFGYTYCPDVCPTTLASLSAVLAKMGEKADKLAIFFVTVDPERDTVEALKSYLSSFDPRIRGLTGPADQIEAAATPLHVVHAKVKGEGGDYTVDHEASVYLIDASGGFAGTISYGEDATVAQQKLELLVKDAP